MAAKYHEAFWKCGREEHGYRFGGNGEDSFCGASGLN
jgi:hypothetical protein